MNTLQQGATLQGGRYRILGVLGQGGFGITYLAEQTGLGRKVAIKEFFMKEWCERDASTSRVTLGTAGSSDTVSRFREKFMKEARNISRLNHPNIVRIHDVFEENGTAYYVMDYAEGGSLADLVKRKDCLSEADATRYILQVADALQYIHAQNMAHLDVKPANILLNERGEAILIDFGLSKQYDATSGGQTSTTPVGISEGYAPMEQYRQGGVSEFSPETDIYSLGATFFKLLTGKTPPTASDIFEDGIPVQELKSRGVSQATITIITQAMEPRRKQRMKDVKVVIQGLGGNVTKHSEGNSDVTPVCSSVENAESTRFIVASASREENFAKNEKEGSKKDWKGILGMFTLRVFLVYLFVSYFSSSFFDLYFNHFTVVNYRFLDTLMFQYLEISWMAIALFVATVGFCIEKKKGRGDDYNKNREVLIVARFGALAGMAWWCVYAVIKYC